MGANIDYSQIRKVDNLDTIFITGGGYINKAFKGISNESAWGWNEVVWASDLNRSNDFSFTNIDQVDFGEVANVEVIFPLLCTEDFIAMQKILHERHVIVTYFCIDDMEWHTKEMAITGNERKRIYNFGKEVYGIRNVKVKFVATNRKVTGDTDFTTSDELSIIYNANSGVGKVLNDSVLYTEQYRTRDESTYKKSGYHIKEWNTQSDGSGASYLPNQSITVCNNLTLYAIWEK